MPELRQLVAQLDEIVDFAGIDQGGRRPPLRHVLHRLHAACDIDDGKAPMPEPGMPIDPDTTRIRAAALHRLRHRFDGLTPRGEVAIVANPASYAAHPVLLLLHDHMQVKLGEGYVAIETRKQIRISDVTTTGRY